MIRRFLAGRQHRRKIRQMHHVQDMEHRLDAPRPFRHINCNLCRVDAGLRPQSAAELTYLWRVQTYPLMSRLYDADHPGRPGSR